MLKTIVEDFLRYKGCTDIKVNIANDKMNVSYNLPSKINAEERKELQRFIQSHLEGIAKDYGSDDIIGEILRL